MQRNGKKEVRVQVLHGPNLNRLGTREIEIYGTVTLEEINQRLVQQGHEWGLDVECHQSQMEGQLIEWIHEAEKAFDYIIFNPGAYTHYSYALRDAISSIHVPVIEVHLTNIYAREPFRAISVISPVSLGQITGLGPYGYEAALMVIHRMEQAKIEI